MARKGTVAIKFTGDVRDLTKSLGEVDRGLGGVGQKLSSAGQKMTLFTTVPIVAGAAMAVRALGEMERLTAQTEAAITSTGGAAGVTAEDIVGLADQIEKLTGLEAENVQEGANMLLTFTNIKNEVGEGNNIFDQSTSILADMSVAMGKDMSSSAVMLGKALNDPVAGVTALGKAGVQLTKEQKDQIRAFTESGDVMSAQKIILGELTTQFGGSAEAFGNTLPGEMAKAKNALGEMTENMVVGAMPAIKSVATGVSGLAAGFGALPGPVQTGAVALLAVGAAAGPIMTVTGNVIKLGSAASDMAGKLKAANLSSLTLKAGLIGMGVAAAHAAVTAKDMGGELIKAFSEAGGKPTEDLIEAFDQLGGSLEAFEKLAESDLVAATRLRNGLKDLGRDTTDLDGIIDGHSAAQKKLKAETDKATKSLEDETGAVEDLGDETDETVGSLEDLLSATMSLIDADLAYQGQLDRVEDALADLNETTAEVMATKGLDKAATEDMERATLAASEAILGQAAAAADMAVKQAGLTDATEIAALSAKTQKTELEKVRDTLAPGSPLRKQLDEWIYRLSSIPASKSTTIGANTGGAEAQLIKVKNLLDQLGDKQITVETFISAIRQEEAQAGNRAPGNPQPGATPRTPSRPAPAPRPSPRVQAAGVKNFTLVANYPVGDLAGQFRKLEALGR